MGLEFAGLQSGGLESGGIESRVSDFGSGIVNSGGPSIGIDACVFLFFRFEKMSKSELSAWLQRLASTC